MAHTRVPNRLASLVLSAALGACAAAPDAERSRAQSPQTVEAPYSSHTVRYRCDGGAELDVVYLNLTTGEALAALHHAGRTVLMRNRPAASGARYIALDEQHSLRWHTQGNEGQLSFLAADHTAREQTLLNACRAVAPR